MYSKWFSDYNRLHPNIQINYQAIGSGGGIRQVSEGVVDFGATDGPMTPSDADAAPAALESLAGFYEAQAGRGITIIVENGKLYGEPTGNPRRELVLQSGTTYSVAGTESPMTVTFVLGGNGRVTEMVMRQGNGERRFPKTR
jgi:ABC-type phosphate transport system substrate-binding protein